MSKLAVLVMHQCENNRPYLDMCLQGLEASRGVDFQSFLISGIDIPKPEYLYKTSLIVRKDWVTATAKIHGALEILKDVQPDWSHILLLSDDVVLSEWALHDMYHAFQGRDLIMNPMSNSDCRSLYEADLSLAGQNIKPDMSIEDFKLDPLSSIIRYPRGNKCIVPFQCVSFFCTMIPRTVWEKVGGLDPELEYRHNDQDFCLRAYKLGIPSVVNFGTFAFHFGSRTINQLANDEMKNKCTDHFKKKWGIA